VGRPVCSKTTYQNEFQTGGKIFGRGVGKRDYMTLAEVLRGPRTGKGQTLNYPTKKKAQGNWSIAVKTTFGDEGQKRFKQGKKRGGLGNVPTSPCLSLVRGGK